MNLWQGEIITQLEFKQKLIEFGGNAKLWGQPPLEHEVLFRAIIKLVDELKRKNEVYVKFFNELKHHEDIKEEEIPSLLDSLIEFLAIDNLREKLKREFNTEYPFELKRITLRENHFEAWIPLGVLVHITPNNSPLLGIFAMMEGLLSGNINVLKLARKDGFLIPMFFNILCNLDHTGTLKKYIFIGSISSTDKILMGHLLNLADVISAWGSEESIKSIRALAPEHTKIVSWGHKISFCYISRFQMFDSELLDKLAFEICNNEQMACSSPQCVFIENADFSLLEIFAQELSYSLHKISPKVKRIMPSDMDNAEITVSSELVRLNSIIGNAKLVTNANHEWRIFIDTNETLSTSPLFRTIWLRPLARKNIISALKPFKPYLQTVGLAAATRESELLMRDFFLAGIKRVRPIGSMTDSYNGEPHDGIFALSAFCQKVSYTDNGLMDKKASLQLFPKNKFSLSDKIMTKEDFQNQKVAEIYSDLFFHSGGSSGKPKLSIFSYDDYHRQMEVAADGLYAAGLDPKTDRCMNLFYAGNLYGGFISFFTILEKMEAIHFPMGATSDFALAAETIIANKVTTLLGMPSYIMQLFTKCESELKKYAGIKKIFFGGEHFSEAQQSFLKKNFKVELVRSASYGSVDAGPLGFQCDHCTGSIHHLHERLHDLEVVSLFSDQPVKLGEIGRLLFTSKVRHGQKITRYEIGDVGKIVPGMCGCGRSGVRFELLGRHGDVFRIGTIFLSYQKFNKILIDKFSYEGVFQLHLYAADEKNRAKVVMYLEQGKILDHEIMTWNKHIIESYAELAEVVIRDLVLDFEIVINPLENFLHNNKTGKLKSVIDHRHK